MRPAFSSTRQAGAFVFILAAILLLPVVMRRSFLPSREEIYSSLSWGAGSFPYLHDQIFEEKGDIDVAFMGSSRMWWGIDVPQVEKQLSERLGRKAVARSLCWNGPGYDAMYFIMKDLLEHRRARMIVICDCSTGGGNVAHRRAPFLFRFADNAGDLDGLTLASKVTFYSSSILGMPRSLLSLARTNLPVIPSAEIGWGSFTNVASPADHLGSLAIRLRSGGRFEDFTPEPEAKETDVCVYSSATKDAFRFSTSPISTMQDAFAKKIGALAEQHHVKLVFLHMPQGEETGRPVIDEPTFWPDRFGSHLIMMGIAPSHLFKGISQDDVPRFFYNFEHLNQNGQEFFTRVMAPSLAKLYEEQVKF